MPDIFSRPVSDPSDLRCMIELSNRFPDGNLRVTDLPYRLSSWALDAPENASLWFTPAGELVAWAVMQSPFWTIDYALDPRAGHLHRHILAWAHDRAQALTGTPYARPSWFVTVFADQSERIHDLEAAGFTSQADMGEDSWSKVFMERDAQAPVKDYRIPEGFTIRPLGGEREVPAYVELHQAVFESKNMTVEWRACTLRHPDYTPELDLVVAAPDGRLGAFCICWLNRNGKDVIGQIEPLGCHADFRHLALGRLALAEGLRRLRDRGAKRVYVETDNYRDTAMHLYESVGFRKIRDVLVFRKNF